MFVCLWSFRDFLELGFNWPGGNAGISCFSGRIFFWNVPNVHVRTLRYGIIPLKSLTDDGPFFHPQIKFLGITLANKSVTWMRSEIEYISVPGVYILLAVVGTALLLRKMQRGWRLRIRRTHLGAIAAVVVLVAVVWICVRRSPVEVPIGKELCTTSGFSITRVAEDPAPASYGFSYNGDAFNAEAESIQNVLVVAYHIYPGRMDFRTPLPPGRYDMKLPGNAEDPSHPPQAIIGRALHEAFRLKFTMDDEEAMVLVLSVPHGAVPGGIIPARPGEKWGNHTVSGGQQFTAYTIDQLSDWMEHKMQTTPIINQTHLAGAYDFVLNDQVLFDSDDIPKYVGQLGFQLKQEKRRIHMLIVERD